MLEADLWILSKRFHEDIFSFPALQGQASLYFTLDLLF